ncbi:tautomerase family protein [Nitrospirillum iridis]|uniref:4-oxalocrotonate tautomerase n=1 Tax=Nitrospirillum iridis TaxID=765888 RepID=A0A7X0EEH8_9PROT|nr:tautomerase family protein [Nitrospirillum iridis]MBB6252076.1 4-oxalocrotonate tautomerase [Nitrospirillum iridis]
MPHVIMKLYAGQSDEKKAALAEALAQAVIAVLGSREGAVSVGVEDVAPADWAEAVYRPDIVDKAATLFKKPDYNPL